jgi:hypothetical protein
VNPISHLSFKGIGINGIPIGIGFLVFGAAIAKFWRISKIQTITEPDGRTNSLIDEMLTISGGTLNIDILLFHKAGHAIG